MVRVLAPLIGFGAAALLHMMFNSQATLNNAQGPMLIYWLVAVPLVLSAVSYVVRQFLKQGRMLATRLGDYVQLGWLPGDRHAGVRRQRCAGGP